MKIKLLTAKTKIEIENIFKVNRGNRKLKSVGHEHR